jgi:hypothetical protein
VKHGTTQHSSQHIFRYPVPFFRYGAWIYRKQRGMVVSEREGIEGDKERDVPPHLSVLFTVLYICAQEDYKKLRSNAK